MTKMRMLFSQQVQCRGRCCPLEILEPRRLLNGIHANVGDFVWHDLNVNGVQDAGEPGIANVTVNLLPCDSLAVLATTTTNANGLYSFLDIDPGSYRIQFIKPAGPWSFSPKDAGGDDAVDSDPDIITGITDCFTVVANQYDWTHDAGLYLTGINVVKLTNGTDNDSPTGPIVAVGSTVTWTYNVTNTGDEPLAGVTVTDDNGTPGNTGDDFSATYVSGDANMNSLLDKTETWAFTASGTAVAGQYANLATADGTGNVSNKPVTDTNPDHYFGQEQQQPVPGINIVKLANGSDNDTPTGPVVTVGSTVTWTYNVTNTGNEPLDNVVVTDDNGTPLNTGDDFNPTFVSGDNDMNGLLDLTETWVYSASTTAVAGQYANLATADGEGNTSGGLVSDTNPDHYFGQEQQQPVPGINIVKLTNGSDNDTPTGPVVTVGSTVTWTYNVTNTGNEPLDNVVVTDDNGTPLNTGDDFNPTFVSGDSDMNGLLDLTETWVYSASTTAVAGQYANLATADGEGNTSGGLVSDTNPDHYFGQAGQLVAVDLEKFVRSNCPGTEGKTPGYWKQDQHFDEWTGYTTGQSYNDVFGVNDPADWTLLEALGTGGGGNEALARHAVAGLLNAAHPNIDYAYTQAEVIALVQNAYATGDFETPKNLLEVENEKEADIENGGGGGDCGLGEDADTPETAVEIPPGNVVTWSYKVTNTGDADFADTDIVIVDDNGTPSDTSDDFGTADGKIVFDPTQSMADSDDVLEPDEMWVYTASGVAQDLGPDECYGNTAVVTAQEAGDTDLSYYCNPAVPALVPLSGSVWHDVDGNGMRNGTEKGLAGVTVTLTSPTLRVGPTVATTDSNGAYSFAGVQCGQDYTLSFTKPTGYQFTTPDAPGTTDANDSDCDLAGLAAFTLPMDAQTCEMAAGLYKPASIGDLVFADNDGDGLQDYSEPGVAGVTVKLLKPGQSSPVATAQTDSRGRYLFSDLTPGDYQLQFVTPSGRSFTKLDAAGTSKSNNSDADPTTGMTAVTTLVSGEKDTTWDAGFLKAGSATTASVSGLAWVDRDADGVRDSGETGLADVTVRLLKSDGKTLLKTSKTDSQGLYKFGSLAAGQYCVQFVKPTGYSFSDANVGSGANDSDANTTTGLTPVMTLAAGQAVTTCSAGLWKPASIGDLVWSDQDGDGKQDYSEPGVAGVTVRLLQAGKSTPLATMQTNSSGRFLFTDLKPGEYQLQFVAPSGRSFTLLNAAGTTASNNSDADESTGKTAFTNLVSGEVDKTWDVGLKRSTVRSLAASEDLVDLFA